MNTQNIFNFYGQKLNIKLDSSEYYDYELCSLKDYYTDILDFNTVKEYETLIFDSQCLLTPINDSKPFEIEINEPFTLDNCDFTVLSRTQKGWTLDFVFNRENEPWVDNNVFYYWGIKNETDPLNYIDNNLSFSFTSEREIVWKSFRYSGYCETESGFTPTYYLDSGKTPTLCMDDPYKDFNITITFERYKDLIDCEILNEGGLNDLITGYTILNVLNTLTGETPDYELIEILNQKWLSERPSRLGTLKIYLNGRPIYKIEDWEEIIPSKRESDNMLVQIWGGGTLGVENIHDGLLSFNIKSVKYFEEPLNFLNIKHHYITKIKPEYDILECGVECFSALVNK